MRNFFELVEQKVKTALPFLPVVADETELHAALRTPEADTEPALVLPANEVATTLPHTEVTFVVEDARPPDSISEQTSSAAAVNPSTGAPASSTSETSTVAVPLLSRGTSTVDVAGSSSAAATSTFAMNGIETELEAPVKLALTVWLRSPSSYVTAASHVPDRLPGVNDLNVTEPLVPVM
jgi:hypothetical protein